jgi:very-short-patch-repair endonuclease
MGYWKTKMGNENMKSEIKQEILEKLKLGSFRNFGFIEREYPTYYNYLMTTYNFSKNVSEAFYNDLYHPKLSCDHGNRYNFKSFGRGYGFCGSIKNCLCQREQMSENTKDIFKNISDENLQSMIEKRKKTNLEKYGVEHFTKTGEYKEKTKKTNLEKYGVEHFTQTEEYKEKTKHTNLEKFGVENPMHLDEYKELSAEKRNKTMLEKYGTTHAYGIEEFRTKAAESKIKTNQERYGVDYYYQSDEFKEKRRSSLQEKFGTVGFTGLEKTLEKRRNTNLINCGFEHPMKNPDYCAELTIKSKNAIFEIYGVYNAFQSEEIKQKIRKTNNEKYGIHSFKKSHYSDDYKHVLDNKEEFKKLLYEYGTYKLAEMINCDLSTIHEASKKYDISLPPRSRSNLEETFEDFLNHNKINFIAASRRILPSGKELDFYLPEHNLAIEINGIYWHSEISGGKDRNYHYDKWKECDVLGITLLSIQEDEFAEKTNFWLNKILYMTGKLSLKKIHARKCEIRELNNVSEFLETHHIQGFCSSSYKLGLFYDDNLVSVMTFSKPRDNKNKTIDLSRFCNHSDYLVSGGASKLLSYFVKTYGHSYENIISFSDNNYSNGNVYGALGFDLAKELAPDYKYTKQGKRYHKAAFRKDAIFSKFDIPEDMKNATEWELMQYLGYDRIWDTGKKKWEMKI